MRKIAIAVTLAGALALSACKKDPPEDLPPGPGEIATPTPTPGPLGPQGPIPGTQPHFAQMMQGSDTIYFDTDRFDIDSEDQAALRQQAQYLQQYPNVRATVEGHCDERGTREYNIALGERRANAARTIWSAWGSAPIGSAPSATARNARWRWARTSRPGRATAARSRLS